MSSDSELGLARVGRPTRFWLRWPNQTKQKADDHPRSSACCNCWSLSLVLRRGRAALLAAAFWAGALIRAGILRLVKARTWAIHWPGRHRLHPLALVRPESLTPRITLLGGTKLPLAHSLPPPLGKLLPTTEPLLRA